MALRNLSVWKKSGKGMEEAWKLIFKIACLVAGLFLYLNETVLRLPELAMYNLEMGLMMPSDSLYLARIMTSFLSTYYERNLISHRPPMHFKSVRSAYTEIHLSFLFYAYAYE